MGLDLSKFERKRYTQGKTPIEYLANLTEIIGGPEIYLKHDDLLGLAGGGNKTRKLEFLVADAQSRGADTLITCGALQSNHCRLTLAAARKEGYMPFSFCRKSYPEATKRCRRQQLPL